MTSEENQENVVAVPVPADASTEASAEPSKEASSEAPAEPTAPPPPEAGASASGEVSEPAPAEPPEPAPPPSEPKPAASTHPRRGRRLGRRPRPKADRPRARQGEEGGTRVEPTAATAPVEPAETHESKEPGEARVRRETKPTPLRHAIDQVRRIKESLNAVLRDLNEVLKLLDEAEREKLATKSEIDALRESLRSLQTYRDRSRRPPPGTGFRRDQ